MAPFYDQAKTLAELPAGGDVQTTDLLLIERADGFNYTILGDVFTSSNPMTTLGDLIIGGIGGVATRLAGNITTVPMYLKSLGNGTVATLESWTQIAYTDLSGRPTLGTVAQYNVGTAVGNIPQIQSGGQFASIGGAALLVTNPTTGTITSLQTTVNNLYTSAATATNLAGGVLGSTPYQSAPSITAFLAPNTTTSLKVFSMTGNGTIGAAPVWYTVTPLNTVSTIVSRDGSGNFAAGTITATFIGNLTGTASSATNLAGGVLGSTPYQSGSSVTAFLAPNTTTSLKVFSMTGDGTIGAAPVWYAATPSNTVSTIVSRDGSGDFAAGNITGAFIGNLTGIANSANNLIGGSAYSIVYQSATSTTQFLTNSVTPGYVLTATATVPQWAPASITITVSNASSVNTLTTTVNGVTGTGVPIINSLSNTSSVNTLTTTANGVTGTGVPIINSLSNTSSVNTLSTTANGVTGTGVSIINSLSNTSSVNTLTTTANGVTGTGVSIINSNTSAYTGNTLTNTINGVASTPLTIDGSSILGFDPVNGIATNTVLYNTALTNLYNATRYNLTSVAATTSNVTISNPATSIFDGVTVSNGQRILLLGQTAGSENGVYVFNGSSSALTRDVSANTGAKIVGSVIPVIAGGTTNGNTMWMNTNTSITLGTTSITFTYYPSVLPITSSSTNAAFYPTFVSTSGTGRFGLNSVSTFQINPSTGIVTATGFSGTYNATSTSVGGTYSLLFVNGTTSGSYALNLNSAVTLNASNGIITAAGFNGSILNNVLSTNQLFYPVWVGTSTSGTQTLAKNANFNYNPSTGVLVAPTFSGALSGNATTATTATNIAGGTANQIPVQSGVGTTTFIPNGVQYQSLVFNGSGAPTFQAINLAQTNAVTGNLAVTHLDSGNLASSTTFWRGDGAWGTPSASSVISLNPSLTGWTNVGSPTITSQGTQIGSMIYYTIKIAPGTSISATSGVSVVFVTPTAGSIESNGSVVNGTTLTNIGPCISHPSQNWLDMPTTGVLTDTIILTGFFSII